MKLFYTRAQALSILQTPADTSFVANVVSSFKCGTSKLVALAILARFGRRITAPGSEMPYEGVWLDGYFKTWEQVEAEATNAIRAFPFTTSRIQ